MPEGTQKDSTPAETDETGTPTGGCSAGGRAASCGGGGCGAKLARVAEAGNGAGDGASGTDLVVQLSSGDMARGCETTVRTVRFYEEAGLIEPVARSEGGHRMYHREQQLKLQLIMDLREAGLSLQDIKSLFELKDRCGTAEEASAEMVTALEAQIECMQRKIAVLRRLREELASMVASIRECRTCEAPEFKAQCDGCDVMNRPDLPRAMRLLWGSRG